MGHVFITGGYIFFDIFIGSSFAGLWRINLMPIDTTKTIMQVHGKKGLLILREKIKINGFHVLYSGGISMKCNKLSTSNNL